MYTFMEYAILMLFAIQKKTDEVLRSLSVIQWNKCYPWSFYGIVRNFTASSVFEQPSSCVCLNPQILYTFTLSAGKVL